MWRVYVCGWGERRGLQFGLKERQGGDGFVRCVCMKVAWRGKCVGGTRRSVVNMWMGSVPTSSPEYF